MGWKGLHSQLKLRNFTVFERAEFSFVPGINVVIGENGSGKTHLLKCLYSWHLSAHLKEKGRPSLDETILKEVFRVDTLEELKRDKTEPTSLSGVYDGTEWERDLSVLDSVWRGGDASPNRPVYIPSIEMMALARNMDGVLRDYSDFDRTCFDYVSLLTAKEPSASSFDTTEANSAFRELLPGTSFWDKEAKRFYLVSDGAKIPFQILAEGERKVAGLIRLLDQGFIKPGTVLFWDEPEVNLNPKWMDEVVGQLVAIASQGTQIFLATHSYVILKELQLALRQLKLGGGSPPSAKYFSLSKSATGASASVMDDFASLEPNAILDQYESMMVKDMALESRADYEL